MSLSAALKGSASEQRVIHIWCFAHTLISKFGNRQGILECEIRMITEKHCLCPSRDMSVTKELIIQFCLRHFGKFKLSLKRVRTIEHKFKGMGNNIKIYFIFKSVHTNN